MCATRELKNFQTSFARDGRNSSGFSLIELLVVIAIIGLLTTIVMASLTSARARGRDGRRLSDIKQLQLALQMYYDAHNNAYPTALSALSSSNYIPAIPTDPRTGNQYAYVALQGAGATAASCASYHLGAKLEIYSAQTFVDDVDATAGGTYGTGSGDGTLCSGSSWVGGDIPAVSGDFSGDNDATNMVYDVRP